MAVIIKGQQLTFGTGLAANLITSASVNKTSSKKEIPDGAGGFGAVVYYGVKSEVSLETYAEDNPDIGDLFTLPALIATFVQGLVIVTSSEMIESNEDMRKSNITAVSFEQITS